MNDLHFSESVKSGTNLTKNLSDKIRMGFFHGGNRSQGAQRKILPDFIRTIFEASRIKQTETMIGVEGTQRRVKIGLGLNPSSVMLEHCRQARTPFSGGFGGR